MTDADPPRRSIFRSRTTLVVALSACVVIVAVYWWYSRRDDAARYVTAPVTRGVVAPYITASGTVNPVVTVQVGSYVSGVIQ
ncbi:MAG TPA: hypothetical protein VET48_00165 [Steroidobacteraceae bacterium]|nr:hypothetical protein [Steroidobacteraceae bacterium]